MEYQPTKTAKARFSELDKHRTGLLDRCVQYAQWTLPKMFIEDGVPEGSRTSTNDYQSFGAQLVNNLVNRMMLTMFPVGKPSFRLAFTPKARAEVYDAMPPKQQAEIDNALSQAERDSAAILDSTATRPTLYDADKLLIITGNALLIDEGDALRVLNLRHYVVRRSRRKRVLELIIKERVHKEELLPTVTEWIRTNNKTVDYDTDGYVDHYKWITLDGGKYHESQGVGCVSLPREFDSTYAPDKLPYHVLAWDLAPGDHYGSGMVEDYAHDFAAMSQMSLSLVQGALLLSEYRWLCDPMGATKPADLEKTANGSALPGKKGDIDILTANVGPNVEMSLRVAEVYIRRLGAAFLLSSAVIRDSERTTMYEVRKMAEELEAGLGGAYSRIGVELQLPVANWCLRRADRDVLGTQVQPIVLTGLAALSRTGDRDRMMIVAEHVGKLGTLPPPILDRMLVDVWMDDFCSAEGLPTGRYWKTSTQLAAEQDAQRQNEAALRVDEAAATSQATGEQQQ